MGWAIDKDFKQQIVINYNADNMNMAKIAALEWVSIGFVSKVLHLHCLYGQVTDPFNHPAGWKPELHGDDLLYVEVILQANPSLYLDEIQGKLTSVWDVNVLIVTIAQALQHLDLTQKSTIRAAAQCNEDLHTQWEAEMAEYTDPEVFIFLDESAVDESTAECTWGQSLMGTHCVQCASFVHGIWHSILLVLTCEGIIALEIFEGSVNKENFLEFLHLQVMCTFTLQLSIVSMFCPGPPQLNLYPGKQSVAVLDNCLIYHDAEVCELIVNECGMYSRKYKRLVAQNPLTLKIA